MKKSKEKRKMLIFETHFHINQNENSEKYVTESMNIGVACLLAVAADRESCDTSLAMSEKFDNVFCSIGIHPHDAEEIFENISDIKKLAKSGKCIAIGETGLDYFYENTDRKLQKRAFEVHLELALTLNLPVIVHCRDRDCVFDAYADSYGMLREFSNAGGRFVIHCFTGDTDYAGKFLDLGAYIGVTGIVTFPKAENVREIVRYVPVENLLLETDAPYLAPKPFRGKENHSKYLPYIADAVAVEKGVTSDALCLKTFKNALDLFKKAESFRKLVQDEG